MTQGREDTILLLGCGKQQLHRIEDTRTVSQRMTRCHQVDEDKNLFLSGMPFGYLYKGPMFKKVL